MLSSYPLAILFENTRSWSFRKTCPDSLGCPKTRAQTFIVIPPASGETAVWFCTYFVMAGGFVLNLPTGQAGLIVQL